MRDVSTTGRYVPFSLKYGDTVYNNKKQKRA